jgi:hypothetical protein
MNNRITPLLILLALSSSCSAPQQQEESLSFSEAPAAEPATELSEESNFTKLLVDKRERARAAYRTPQSKASPSLTYRDPGAPKPFRPESASITVYPQTPSNADFASDIPSGLNTIFFNEGFDSALGGFLARAMMRKSLIIVDRDNLGFIQKELLLQGGYAATPIANLQNAGYIAKKGATTRGIDGTVYESLLFEPTQMLAQFQRPTPFGLLVPWWIWKDGSPERLVSGKRVNDADHVDEARILPAEAMFSLLHEEATAATVSYDYRRPKAHSIPYGKDILHGANYSWGSAGDWTQNLDDPFHFECTGAGMFFDPLTSALWSITDAYIGKEVTRDEFLARRTKHEEDYCGNCNKHLGTESTPPNADDYPLHWFCKDCSDQKDVRYFDGYHHASDKALPDGFEKAIVQWSFNKIEPGIYPVMSPGNIKDLQHSPFLLEAKTWSTSTLQQASIPAELAKGNFNLGWAIIDKSGMALFIDAQDYRAITKLYGADAYPSITPNGEQTYSLTSAPYYQDTMHLPYSTILAAVKMINTEESRYCMQGSLFRDYFDVMTAPITIIADADGPDLSEWPVIKAQQRALRLHVTDTIISQFQ